MSKRDELKGRREKRYRLNAIPDIATVQRRRNGLGDLPPTAQVERFEEPRLKVSDAPRYAPSAGIVGAGGPGISGPDIPKPDMSVTSVFDGRPLRATDFLVFGRMTTGSPS